MKRKLSPSLQEAAGSDGEIIAFLSWATKELALAGLEEPRREARFILSDVGGISLARQYASPQGRLPAALLGRVREAVERRRKREPMSRILGRQGFFSREFKLNDACLAPRPETECLVLLALELLAAEETAREERLSILDLCCGSGAIGLSVLAELEARGIRASLILADISNEALAMAALNAKEMGLIGRCRLIAADLFSGEAALADLDMILCNPPYIPSADLALLMPEVRDYEPPLCLDGGRDGLDFYRRLAAESPLRLKEGGWLIMEHGATQREELRGIFAEWRKCGAREIFRNDDVGNARVLAYSRQN